MVIQRVLGLKKFLVYACACARHAVIQAANIAACTVGFFSCASRDDGINIFITGALFKYAAERTQHIERERVQRLRAIERDAGNVIAYVELNIACLCCVHILKVVFWRAFSAIYAWKRLWLLDFHLFFHCGLRFSKKAFTPSVWSSNVNKSMKRSRSNAKPAVRGMPLRAL